MRAHTTGLLLITATLALHGCGGGSVYYQDDGPPGDYHEVGSNSPDAVPRAEPRSKYGNPKSYVVFGKRYYVRDSAQGYSERGIASWYGKKFHGRRTSSGEAYDMYKMTAAHKTLPLPSYVEVTNLKNGKTAVVRVNDRGPFHEGRIIDLSLAAAKKLGIAGSGTGLVEVRAIAPGHQQGTRYAGDDQQQQIDSARNHVRINPDAQIYLQLGAFRVRTNAEQLRLRTLSKAIAGAFISNGTDQYGEPIYRVRVGPLASVDLADNMISRLLDTGFEEFRVVIE